MATSFDTICNRAIYKFKDYDFLDISEAIREDILEKYLFSAQSDFQDICRIDIKDRDDALKQYNNTLDDQCVEILALGVAYYWLSAKVMNSELLHNNLSVKDYSFFSPANLLREVVSAKESIGKEYRQKIVNYSYYAGNIADLQV